MNYQIKEMAKTDWQGVVKVYSEGINTGKATFQTDLPSFAEWDDSHTKTCRLVAHFGNKVLGWCALSLTSSRCVYAGVAEVSIYIGEEYRGKGIGKALLNNLVKLSEENGFWTLQSGIIKENVGSIVLHKNCGFREIGIREKISKMNNGEWHDVILMERRSKIIGID